MQVPAGMLEHRAKHGRGEFAGGCVLLARMVGTDQQRLAFAGSMLRIVSEHESGSPRNLAPIAQDSKVYIERQPAERHHHLNIVYEVHLALQIRAASVNLLDGWLVVRWGATDCGADVRVDQLQPVVARNAGGLGGKAGGVEDRVQKISRAIAGEYASRAIGAVGPWGEADQKQPGVGIAKAWHWFRPIIPVQVRTALDAAHFFAIGHQARALLARDDLAL
jgi:hypothetical protein